MSLKISHRKEEEVPSAFGQGRVNQDLQALKSEMSKLAAGMVLEIEAGTQKAVRGTKMLVTKAARELGTEWRHWNLESKVYAKPVDAAKRRGRRKNAA